MTNTATVTLGECTCGEKTPHLKFSRGGESLHDSGFFSVEDGREQLDELIGAGDIDPEDRDRLVGEIESSGLPPTHDDATANTLAGRYGFTTAASLAMVLALLSQRGLTVEVANKVRTKIGTMTDDEKIAGAVNALKNAPLGDPDFREMMAKDVDPTILDRIRTQAEEAAVDDTAKTYGFLNSTGLGGLLDDLVGDSLTTEMAARVRTKVDTMTEDERVESGVLYIRGRDLNDPRLEENMTRDIDPALAARIMAGAKDYQAANPPPSGDPMAEFTAALSALRGRVAGGNA